MLINDRHRPDSMAEFQMRRREELRILRADPALARHIGIEPEATGVLMVRNEYGHLEMPLSTRTLADTSFVRSDPEGRR